MTRRLVLVRHAKAEPFASSDRARELTDRGRREAEAAGRYLREQGIVADLAVVSSSVRTRDTWQAMEQALESEAEVVYDDAVYSGSTDVVLEALRVVPDWAKTVVFVGHQPTVGHVAHMLDDGEGDHAALHSMLHGFPTASMAVFDVEVPWLELGDETGRLVDFRPGS
ncbi:MAG TPA: histidine phosphatase family protein [Nocardioidaceae bacterium]|nr:histidine phosphatase family protein [Nocardioidaceae bacterium]